jgi:hypothetical protein
MHQCAAIQARPIVCQFLSAHNSSKLDDLNGFDGCIGWELQESLA